MLKEIASPNFTPYPLLWLAACFAVGILTANLGSFDWKIFLVICLLQAVLTVLFIKQKKSLIFLSLAFAAAGALCFQLENQHIAPHRIKRIYDEKRILSGEPVEIEGVLGGKPELAVGGFFLELRAEKLFYKEVETTVSGKVRLFAASPKEQISGEYEQLDLQYGSKIRVACRLLREDGFLNPGVARRKEILDQKEIDATGLIKSPLLIEKNDDAPAFAPARWIYERRQNLIDEFRARFSVSTAGIMIASLLGNKYFLDRTTAELFREGGTFHVLVISGLHITFIGGLTLLLVRFFTRRRFWQFVIATAFLWAFSIAVGAEVPVVRATLMFTILLFSQVIFRRGTLLNSLGACALILLVWRPNDLFSQSFQLTFTSVAAIVAGAFPLIENLRKIGDWRPSAETPFPPFVPVWLKRFCEMLYWNEKTWEIENKQQIWSARLFKAPHLKWLAAKNLQSIFRYLFEGVLISLVVQIWLLPLTIFYFHQVSIASVLLNLWVGIFIAAESFAAVIAIFFAQISGNLALPLIKLTEILNWILLSLPRLLVENDWASFRVPVYGGAGRAIYFLYFLPILILTSALNRWRPFENSNLKPQIPETENDQSAAKFISLSAIYRAAASLLLLLTGLLIFHPFSRPKADGRLRIDFLDVGQGDAALITFPNGETLLVDGGGKPNLNKFYIAREGEDPEIFEPDAHSIGETVVSQFLWEKGYSEIDYILATHSDADHIQGLKDAAKNFRVRAAFFGRTPETDEDYRELSEILRQKRIPVLKLSRGDVLNFGGASVEVLFPANDDSPRAASDNNHSLVLRLNFGAKKILLTGDIEKETEKFLVQMPGFLRADVVKVAHHGSRTSSIEEFVNATKAVYAVIPVGRTSQFGHPHEEVLERWKKSGGRVLTTGERGTITVSTDGKDLQISTYLKNDKTP